MSHLVRAIRSAVVATAIVGAIAALPATATSPGTNGKFLFERPNKAGVDLFTLGADGTGQARLKMPGFETEAAWAPDGSKIAFGGTANPDKPFKVFVMNPDGSGRERLTKGNVFSTAPAWSPDGSKIVYASDNGGDELRLYTMNADGTGKHLLVKRSGRNLTDPGWSPDGNTIVYAVLKAPGNAAGFDSSLAAIGADGSGKTQLTKAGGRDELNPNWSPDGETIAFEVTKRFDTKQSDLALMDADGSNVRKLTKTNVFETNPIWSPDGVRIAFTSDRDNRDISKERLGDGFDIYTMAPDGTGIERVTHNKKPELFPDWQPLK